MHVISLAGLAHLKQYEGLRLKAYRCSAGKLTIGYGHTGPDVTEGLQITELQALQLLKQDTSDAQAAVNRLVKKILKPAQFDALVSFAFNAGAGALAESTLLRLINQDPNNPARVDISAQDSKPEVRGLLLVNGIHSANVIEYNFYKWIWQTNPKTGKKEVSQGLLNRRRQEAALYFTPSK